MSRVLPILFNTDMVRAILDNRKTAARRYVKGFIPDDAIWGYTAFTPKGYISCRGTFADGYGEKFFKLPCQKDDTLYVRETWSTRQSNACILNTTGRCPYDSCETAPGPCFEDEYIYKATDRLDSSVRKWHPSIHMPKEAARIFLRVTDVRVERLQEMWASDVPKEGIYFTKPHSADEMIAKFTKLWNSTIPKKNLNKCGWEANPWVWVIEFERCEKPESDI